MKIPSTCSSDTTGTYKVIDFVLSYVASMDLCVSVHDNLAYPDLRYMKCPDMHLVLYMQYNKQLIDPSWLQANLDFNSHLFHCLLHCTVCLSTEHCMLFAELYEK